MNRFAPALLAVALALPLAACGSDSSSSNTSSSSTTADTSTAVATTQAAAAPSGGGGEQLALAADPSALKFNKTSLSAKAGNVTIKMANPSNIPHAIAIEGNGVDKDGEVVQHGGVSKVTADLKPGTYTFYCPVPGHEQGGMKGTLTVK